MRPYMPPRIHPVHPCPASPTPVSPDKADSASDQEDGEASYEYELPGLQSQLEILTVAFAVLQHHKCLTEENIEDLYEFQRATRL